MNRQDAELITREIHHTYEPRVNAPDYGVDDGTSDQYYVRVYASHGLHIHREFLLKGNSIYNLRIIEVGLGKHKIGFATVKPHATIHEVKNFLKKAKAELKKEFERQVKN